MLVSRKRLATPYTYRESRPEAREGCTIPIRHGLEILRPLEFWHGLSHYQDYHRQLQTGSDKYHHCRSRVRSGSSEVDITASWAYHLAVLIFLPSYQQVFSSGQISGENRAMKMKYVVMHLCSQVIRV